MTEHEYAVLVNYTRDCADSMGLKDWQFDLSHEPVKEPGKIAQVEVWGDSETATIWIGESFWKYGPRMQREVVVHELVHCHTDKFFRRAREVMRKTLGREAYEISLDSLEQQHELTVDGIAAAWARQMPFIDWSDNSPIYTEYEAEQDKFGGSEADRKDEAVG